jgi:alkylation response protein AidB-like acyl-CoA dehydrogenase
MEMARVDSSIATFFGVHNGLAMGTPGFKVEKIQNKIALKVVQNGLITLENCRIPEAKRCNKISRCSERGSRPLVCQVAAGTAFS